MGLVDSRELHVHYGNVTWIVRVSSVDLWSDLPDLMKEQLQQTLFPKGFHLTCNGKTATRLQARQTRLVDLIGSKAIVRLHEASTKALETVTNNLSEALPLYTPIKGHALSPFFTSRSATEGDAASALESNILELATTDVLSDKLVSKRQLEDSFTTHGKQNQKRRIADESDRDGPPASTPSGRDEPQASTSTNCLIEKPHQELSISVACECDQTGCIEPKPKSEELTKTPSSTKMRNKSRSPRVASDNSSDPVIKKEFTTEGDTFDLTQVASDDEDFDPHLIYMSQSTTFKGLRD